MYRSWAHLKVKNETELRDIQRIKRVIQDKGNVGWGAVVGFALGGVLSLFITAALPIALWPDLRSALIPFIVMLVFSGMCFFASFLFRKEMQIDYLRAFLIHPENFEFVKGSFQTSYYLATENRSSSRVIVEGLAYSTLGEELRVREEFAPKAWPFTTKEADNQLEKDDDWYDEKGKRPYLPLPAHFICPKHNPNYAALIGVDAENPLVKQLL